MDPWLAYICLALYLLVLAGGWVLTLFTLPGNWVMVAAAAVFAGAMPVDAGFGVSWWTVAGLTLLALLGEGFELLASALGVKQAGGSRRGAVLAMAGSLVGAIGGGMIGLPVPVVGPIVMLLIGAALGSLGGALLGEWWKGRTWPEQWQVGKAAFWARLIGSVVKIVLATLIFALGAAAGLFFAP